jgi:hypothetical protein
MPARFYAASQFRQFGKLSAPAHEILDRVRKLTWRCNWLQWRYRESLVLHDRCGGNDSR